MRLVIVGGGGFRVPLVYRALVDDPKQVIDEVVLYDVDGDRLRVICRVLEGLAHNRSGAPGVRTTTDLADALDGADFVFAAVRPGGLAGREHDEGIPLRHGVLGQETTGIGGILYALRSIPTMRTLAQMMTERCPQAWLINFTNPAGMVTEALTPLLGSRVIGICDSPAALIRRVGRALGVSTEASLDYPFDYVGLNHLGWLRGVYDGGTDLLPALLADDERLASIEEGQLFGGELIRALGCVPNEYLHYFYFGTAVVHQLAGAMTRAAFLRQQQSAFYAAAARSEEPLLVWSAALDERNRTYMAGSREAAGIGERDDEDVEGGGYEQIALEVMRAIATDANTTMVLDVANGGTYADLDPTAVIEVPARVGAIGATPLPARAPLTDHQAGLMRTVKGVERMTITAAVDHDRDALHAALAMHPLNGSYPLARGVLDDWLPHFPDLQAIYGS